MNKSKPTTPLGILRAARKLIERRVTWVKWEFHKTKRVNEKIVHCYCLVGALRKASAFKGGEAHNSAYWKARKHIASCITGFDEFGLTAFNDSTHTKHSDVLKALDCAIEKAKKKKL